MLPNYTIKKIAKICRNRNDCGEPGEKDACQFLINEVSYKNGIEFTSSALCAFMGDPAHWDIDDKWGEQDEEQYMKRSG